MSLSKICLLMACCYTLMNVAMAWGFGHNAAWGVMFALPGDAAIWGIWAAVKTQVIR